METTIVFILFGSFLGLLVIGAPITVALGVAALVSFLYLDENPIKFVQIAFTSVGSFPLMALPAFILAGAAFLTVAMGFTGIPRILAAWIGSLELSPYMLLAALTVFFIVLGCFLDGISVVVLTTAVIQPMIEQAGIEVPILSGGGTGTYDVTGTLDGVDEMQVGSYALMDCCYITIRLEFTNAMTVLATVISKPEPGRVVLDVGLKGLANEFGPPTLLDRPGEEIPCLASEEHVGVSLCGDHPADIGGKLRLIPSHGCTTCNLYREYVVHREGVIEDVWPIEGAGALK